MFQLYVRPASWSGHVAECTLVVGACHSLFKSWTFDNFLGAVWILVRNASWFLVLPSLPSRDYTPCYGLGMGFFRALSSQGADLVHSYSCTVVSPDHSDSAKTRDYSAVERQKFHSHLFFLFVSHFLSHSFSVLSVFVIFYCAFCSFSQSPQKI